MTPARVVVVGGGFAGLAAAKRFAGSGLEVTLVDRNNYHLFTPLLYQVASSLLNPSDIAQPVRSIVGAGARVRFRLGEVTGINLERRLALIDGREVEYDFLLVATGTVTNFFGNAQVEANAHPLKSLPDAVAVRGHILACFERAAWEPEPVARRALLTFVIVGGGPTGVEYAGALSELVALLGRHDFRHLDPAEIRIVLAEGDDHVLAPFAPGLRESARRALEHKRVDVRLSTRVSGFDGQVATFSDGSAIEARTVVWVAGVAASPLAADLTTAPVRGGRVPVTATLQMAGYPEVFVAGDLAGFAQKSGLVPQIAEVAQSQGHHAAENILRAVAGTPLKPWHFRSRGTMATIGRNEAVAQVGPLKLSGLLGWLVWLTVHLFLLIGFRRRLVVFITWGWNYVFYDRPVRLISRTGDHAPPRS